MAHTYMPPPEPPPKAWLLTKLNKLRWSTASIFGCATPFPKSQLFASQEFTRPPSSKFCPVFESSIMGPTRVKSATVDAAKINVHNNSNYSSLFPSSKNRESLYANYCKDSLEGSNGGNPFYPMEDRFGTNCIDH